MKTNNQAVKQILDSIGTCKLVAATKYIDADELIALKKAGIDTFGENRVQAFLDKYQKYPTLAHWHFIGNLQTNKVKDVIGKVELIHSVSNQRLINEIQKQAAKKEIQVNILLEVNISEEASKQGFKKEEIKAVLSELKRCPNINVKGFMMMAPHIDKEDTRIYFREMKQLQITMQKEFPEYDLSELSMGMSNDYEVAIEEGATMIRIGSALFEE